MPSSMLPFAELEDLPAVQDHFQTVLKRRLQVEIDRNPPLFPWESELQDYPVALAPEMTWPWLAQLRSLKLPTTLPESVLAQLLERCQALLHDALQPGVQLVQAVSPLFPEQPQAIDQIAGLMLTAAAGRGASGRDFSDLKDAFPVGYDGANPQQQITLAMLAAREIFEALTLTLTPKIPTLTRVWQTSQGDVRVTVAYHAGANQVAIAATLPEPGSLTLITPVGSLHEGDGIALNLTLDAPQWGASYPLEVGLGNGARLSFAIALADTAA